MTVASTDPERQRDIREAIAAAKAGDLATLRAVIERRPTLVDGRGDHRPLIELAVREGRLGAVRLLIDAGAASRQATGYGDGLVRVARAAGYEASAQHS